MAGPGVKRKPSARNTASEKSDAEKIETQKNEEIAEFEAEEAEANGEETKAEEEAKEEEAGGEESEEAEAPEETAAAPPKKKLPPDLPEEPGLPPVQHVFVIVLADHGFVVHTLQHLHVLGAGGRLLATSTAVVTGITYNFLPFMALPLYVSLEQIDERLLEAAQDLYASKWKAFVKVTLPLSLPGIVAGTLLTFIPAAGDFINAQLLGSPQNHMIGNVIQSKFLELTDYPAAAAMSFILMAGILVAVFLYARAVGTEQLTGTPV